MAKIYNFNRLVNKYSNDITVKFSGEGKYVNGRYVPGESSKTTVRGAVIPYSTSKIFQSGGNIKLTDMQLYTLDPVGFDLDTVKIIYKDKKYTINKQLFKLYWALEALKLFVDDINPEILSTIFNRAMEEKEYTIREKIAQIIKISSSTQFHAMKNELSKDENYYVRVAINS